MWDKDRRLTAAILLIASAIMMFPLFSSWLGQEITLVENLGFSPGELAPLHVWIIAICFAAAYVSYTFWAVPFVRKNQHELSLFKVIGVIAAFASGIMEEVVFRRWLMDTAFALGVPSVGQVILSALVFGACHLVWHLFSADRHFSPFAAASTVIAGAALAIIYLLGDRNLGPCILAHMLINLVIEPWLVLAAVSGVDSFADTKATAKAEP